MKKPYFIDDNNLSFCRLIKNKKTVMEIRIKDGSNHIESMRIAMENKVDFDYYFIYYEEEHNKIRSYGNLLAESPKHAMGMDDSGRFRYIIDSDTNQIVKDLSEFSNSQMP